MLHLKLVVAAGCGEEEKRQRERDDVSYFHTPTHKKILRVRQAYIVYCSASAAFI